MRTRRAHELFGSAGSACHRTVAYEAARALVASFRRTLVRPEGLYTGVYTRPERVKFVLT